MQLKYSTFQAEDLVNLHLTQSLKDWKNIDYCTNLK